MLLICFFKDILLLLSSLVIKLKRFFRISFFLKVKLNTKKLKKTKIVIYKCVYVSKLIVFFYDMYCIYIYLCEF